MLMGTMEACDLKNISVTNHWENAEGNTTRMERGHPKHGNGIFAKQKTDSMPKKDSYM